MKRKTLLLSPRVLRRVFHETFVCFWGDNKREGDWVDIIKQPSYSISRMDVLIKEKKYHGEFDPGSG